MEPKFYIVMDPWKTEYATGELPDNVAYDFDKMERCPLCGAWVSGGYWPQPREVALTNRRVPDFLYSYSYEPFLISARALAVIRQAGCRKLSMSASSEKGKRKFLFQNTTISNWYGAE